MLEYKKPPCAVNKKNKIGGGGNGIVGFVLGHENDFGYRGEYSRKDPQRCLRIRTNYGKTLEPLHLMMEKCSKHDWSERPSIEECMELIEHQIMILRGDFSQQKEREYVIKEQLASYRMNVNPDHEEFRQIKI